MLVAVGLQPDRVTFNTLLKACMRGQLADKALHTFDHMRHLKVPVGLLCLLNSLLSGIILCYPAGVTAASSRWSP